MKLLARLAGAAAFLAAAATTPAAPVVSPTPALGFDDTTDWQGDLLIDREDIKEGIQSAIWMDTPTNDRIRLRKLDLDLSGKDAAVLWVHSAAATGAKIAVVFVSENPATEGPDYYQATIPINFIGWRQIVLPFAETVAKREPLGWSHITEIMFASTGYNVGTADPATVLKLDGFHFVTKAELAGQAPARPSATDGVIPPAYADVLRFDDVLSWKGLVKDSDKPIEGLYSGRWQDLATNDRVQCKNFPSDLSPYKGMTVSIWSAKATGAEIALAWISEDDASDGPDYYITLVPIDWVGWKDVTIDFSRTGFIREPVGWNKIDEFRMASSGYKIKKTDPETLLKFDNIRFLPR
ncbi:MAG: hypothetical protein PWP23_1134 [Candidatus Sumerlaeota bacterium]|nr:hypothetical protein [Candidatus Sumerlaeota bacterium]